MNYILEIATSGYLSTEAAVAGGADRIELCSSLSEGGITPSYALIKICREQFAVVLFPIIRPRGGDFLYTKEEFEIMKNDVQMCRELGCDGVVLGMLNRDGTIDKTRTAVLVAAAYPMEVTFHRAFDRCRDPFEALEDIIDTGCQRILTSGQQPTVTEGMELLAGLNQKAANRILIMPGSGVRKENIKQLAQKTGCTEFHASLRSKVKSSMQYIHPSFAGSEESYLNDAISPDEVRALRNALT